MRILVAAAAAALVVGGCGGGDEAPVTREELSRLVVRAGDLGPQWRQFDRGRQVLADGVPGPRGDPERFGRVEGWKARFRRPGTLETRGPLVLESRADLFPSTDAARDDLEAYGREFSAELEELDGEELGGVELGEDARAITYTQAGAARDVRFYRVAWRRANATSSLTANGFDGRFALDEVLALARKQDGRLERAAESG